MPISAGITTSVSYVSENGVSPLLDLIIVQCAHRTCESSPAYVQSSEEETVSRFSLHSFKLVCSLSNVLMDFQYGPLSIFSGAKFDSTRLTVRGVCALRQLSVGMAYFCWFKITTTVPVLVPGMCWLGFAQDVFSCADLSRVFEENALSLALLTLSGTVYS
ncbi:hypothetical protein Tco_0910071 [Tanacetum coccineum]|uniref:Uncharacterized protein n=1 Tax=Tanacetum coccineum TaxID=301880 RepID=A0ABQ5CRU6_9ASTR